MIKRGDAGAVKSGGSTKLIKKSGTPIYGVRNSSSFPSCPDGLTLMFLFHESPLRFLHLALRTPLRSNLSFLQWFL